MRIEITTPQRRVVVATPNHDLTIDEVVNKLVIPALKGLEYSHHTVEELRR